MGQFSLPFCIASSASLQMPHILVISLYCHQKGNQRQTSQQTSREVTMCEDCHLRTAKVVMYFFYSYTYYQMCLPQHVSLCLAPLEMHCLGMRQARWQSLHQYGPYCYCTLMCFFLRNGSIDGILKKIKASWHICSGANNTGMIIGNLTFLWVSVSTYYWEIIFVQTYLIHS